MKNCYIIFPLCRTRQILSTTRQCARFPVYSPSLPPPVILRCFPKPSPSRKTGDTRHIRNTGGRSRDQPRRGFCPNGVFHQPLRKRIQRIGNTKRFSISCDHCTCHIRPSIWSSSRKLYIF